MSQHSQYQGKTIVFIILCFSKWLQTVYMEDFPKESMRHGQAYNDSKMDITNKQRLMFT